jgi:aquaporin Z
VDRYATELVGTFFLTLAVGFAIVSGSSLGPLAVGLTLMVMTYMGGHVSGAHYNPAASLALFLRGSLEREHLLPYMGAQLAGATLAAWVVHLVTGAAGAPAPGPGVGAGAAFLAELLYTFALVLVFLNVATHPDTEGNPYYGAAIGLTVGAGAFTVGPISGAAFNPAVGAGPLLVSTLSGDGGLGGLWLYLAAPFLGGLAALPVFRLQLGRPW